MHSIETNQKITNYSVQPNGDVWTRFEGRTKIIAAGPEADTFLNAVKGLDPRQLKAFLSKSYQMTHV